MKRKRIYLLLTGLLLISIFSINVFAEEDPESDLGIAEPLPVPNLDSYFYNNYVLLPYIESDNHQIINTNILGSNNLRVFMRFSNLVPLQQWNPIWFAYSNNHNSMYGVTIYGTNGSNQRFVFNSNNHQFYEYVLDQYSIYNIDFDRNDCYLNNELIHSFTDDDFQSSYIYIFGSHDTSDLYYSKYRLYSFFIYDYSLSDPLDPDSDPVGYVRYYYPARSKSGNVIGLYDAVSKTFVTTSTQNAFTNPTGSNAELSITAGITNTLLAGLGWIGQILTFAKSNSVILIFFAIGLTGVAFRWARRVIHF